jgi:aspartyl-tRNA(Asn)/glutamyl-tRNA(Gln) amidotransferase subunit A
MRILMLSSLTITEANEKLRKREISCTELVESCLQRIEAVDPQLHAVVFVDRNRALVRAHMLDEQGDFSQPLTGIPYLAKDLFCEKGVPTTAGSNILRGERGGLPAQARSAQAGKTYRPPYDSTTTKRLSAAGAISLGKTNMDEFAMGSSTESSCYGPTRNPWDLTRVPGGSSGGSAAAVTADECLFALGTDTGGSIRQPAAFCGCVGLKVTYGRTSRYGVIAMASSLDTIGALTKTVEDMAIVLQALAGKDPRDATMADVPVPPYREALKEGVKGLRIGLPREYFVEGMDPEVEHAVQRAAKEFEELGAEVREVSLPHTKYGVATYYIICPSEVSSNLARYDGIRFGHSVSGARSLLEYYERVRSEGFGDEAKRRIMIGTYTLSAGYVDAYYYKALRVRTLVKQDFERAFKEVDVLLTPTAPTPAFRIGEKTVDPVQMYLSDIFTIPASLAGIPAISLPCSFTQAKGSAPPLPIGLQIMGPHFEEALVLRAAHAFEQAVQIHTLHPLPSL